MEKTSHQIPKDLSSILKSRLKSINLDALSKQEVNEVIGPLTEDWVVCSQSSASRSVRKPDSNPAKDDRIEQIFHRYKGKVRWKVI